MRIAFCCLGDFKAPPGARQILLLAQALQAEGHECLVLVEGDPATVRLAPRGAGSVQIDRYVLVGPRVGKATRQRVRAFRPDIVHCYEPRTAPIAAALGLALDNDVPLAVRFADDDELLYREAGGGGLRRLIGRPALIAAGTLWPRVWPYKHPLQHRRMLRIAAAYDAITPALADEISRRYGVACEGILPALPHVDAQAAPASSIPKRLGLPAEAPLVVYTGSVFRPHWPDFEILLRAFGEVAARRPDVRLVHTGRIAERYPERELRALCGDGGDRAHFLGFLESPDDLENLLRGATVLVQPGAPNDFNRLRLPAKLHDYLLAGRPVVTFAVGFGELLEDRREAVLTQSDDPSELATALDWVLDDRARADAIGEAGRRRALELFDAHRIVGETIRYYERALRGASSPTT